MPPAIRVENLGKCYRVRHNAERATYRTLRDSLAGAATATVNRLRGRTRAETDEQFWALKDVSFDVQPGEVVGIIGRNGAGKSTLLKILSRITKPTNGFIQLRGRVGSLLEVGTGFHPELTGRENIYLNGSILGMSRKEIDRRFDEIVAFSEVEKFLDTPVKRYSSGMYVRLAFAVAAHLEPEILIIDEVLAVGDAAFQKKCFGRIERLAAAGRTVFLVSHQMDSVQRLCQSALLLKDGHLAAAGKVHDVVGRYFDDSAGVPPPGEWVDLTRSWRTGDGRARFTAAKYECPDGWLNGRPSPDRPLEIHLRIQSDEPRSVSAIAVSIYDRYLNRLVNADSVVHGKRHTLNAGVNDFIVRLDSLHLNAGMYHLGLWLAEGNEQHDYVERALQFEVVNRKDADAQPTPGDWLVTCNFTVSPK